MKGWMRAGLFSLFTLAFVALAVAIPLLSGPWYLSVAYVACAAVTGTLAWKSRPTQSRGSAVPPPEEQARRARRSGNPAVRARAEESDHDRG